MAVTDLRKPINPLRAFGERLIQVALLGAATVSILTTAGIVFSLLFETIAFFSEVSIVEFLTETEWTPLFSIKKYGIWPLLSATILTSAIAMLVAVPLGLVAAIFLSEFASDRIRRTIKPLLEILAGIPTVVYGYFALTVVTPFLKNFIPTLSIFNSLSAGLVMGVMLIPFVASLSEDALSAVPNSLREAAYGLGS
ncbi:MAG: ABC transporter permease subunit, partial [Chloroflexi bacterium]